MTQRATRRSPRRDQRGAVTAELALGLPVLMALVLALVWMLAVGAAQVRVVDAARETARALARGEHQDAAVELGRRVAPPGATIDVRHEEGVVVVRVRAVTTDPDGLAAALPAARVEAEAVASLEGEP